MPYLTRQKRCLFSLVGRSAFFGPIGGGLETTLPHQGHQLSLPPRGRKPTDRRTSIVRCNLSGVIDIKENSSTGLRLQKLKTSCL
ncbi:hypothetical protein NPIL_85321 [Nephila pilipes]|uniref:Uncharacterized protein n=1 Tax=Nephila pilipes TaxID=299642 RepID=A0A8X6QAN1_NEPPI|nr:hypothetical protein NPIL_85321 [Nephila pilipes]